ncbi:MAG TPA: sigma-70 family RNA polymerase sigma factor [Thermoanaerobaculia bacterium]
MNPRAEPADTDRSDRVLVAAMEARDADALARLYDRHAARLLGVAHRILGETGEAEEVVQEVFLYAWRASSSFDPLRGSVLAWLIIATRSRAIDRLRTRRPMASGAADGRDPLAHAPARDDVEAGSAAREWETICRAAIGDLPADQRRALELAYFDGLTHQEIAGRTATPLGTVKTRIRLGLMKLRERMRPYWEERDA